MMGKVCRKGIGFIVTAVVAISLYAAMAFTAPQSGVALAAQEAPASTPDLDFEFFKARVEPIFLKVRGEHARCYVCHGMGTAPHYLVKLDPGATFWTEEQSRQNFRNLSRLVDHSEPMNSRLLMMPLFVGAGGSEFHRGGRQFESKQDPDWQTLAAWASGQKLASSAEPKK
jgi:hypothetical protein